MITGRILNYALGALLLASLLALGWQWGQAKDVRTELATKLQEHAETLHKLADLTAKALEQKNAREREVRAMLDSSNEAREQGIANAVIEQQRVVSDVRSESLKLRRQWAGCQASRLGSSDAAPSEGVDGDAELRAQDSGNLVRVGLDADIQIIGLQDYARACQTLTAKKP